MKIKTKSFINTVGKQWSGYEMLMVYRFANLCVKAEPMALLSFKVKVEDITMKLEDLAIVASKEWNMFTIYPHDEEYIPDIVRDMTVVHPEFDVNIKRDLMADGVTTGNVIDVTMPKVNKTRRDVLLNGIDVLYNECKANLEKTMNKAMGEVTQYTEDVDAAKKELYDNYDKVKTDAKKQYDDKKKEIEDAYQKYVEENGEDAANAETDDFTNPATSFTIPQ